MRTFPDFEKLSHSEPNVVTKVLGVLLSDDNRQEFLPRFLARTGLGTTADWASKNSQAIFFTRPLRAYLRELALDPEDADDAQREINGFLDLPSGFKLRRNTDGKLTHPRGWNTRFIAKMLDDNLQHTTSVGWDLCESKLWLMEEVANTEVDLILQAGDTIIFCEIKWLSGLGRASDKPALKDYDITQLARQYLTGLYLQDTLGGIVHHLVLTRTFEGDRQRKVPAPRLRELVPSAQQYFELHHVSWQDVFEVASECLPDGHGLLAYMERKAAHRGKTTVPLL